MNPTPSPGRPPLTAEHAAAVRVRPAHSATGGPLPTGRSRTGDRADREDDSQHLVLWPLSLQTAGAGGSGRGWSSAVIPAQLTRTAAAVTDRWAPKNFHIAVDARGPRASLNDPLEEPPDQA